MESIPANEFLSFEKQERTVSDINTSEFVFKDVFENKSANLKLPATKGNFKLSNFASRGEEQLLTYRDGTTYLGKYKTGQGNLYLCSAPFEEDYNNLAQNAGIFVPMLYKMAISSARARPIANTIGRDETIEADNMVRGGESVYKLRGAGEEFIPQQRIAGSKGFLGVHNQIHKSGVYDVFLKQDTMLGKFAFNYDRRESDPAYLSGKQLSEKALANMSHVETNASDDLTEIVSDRSRGVILWKWCVVLALLALGAEVTILRFWRV